MLQRDTTVLVIIDAQEKLAKAMYEQEAFARNLQMAIRGAQVLDIPVIGVEQYPQGLGPTIPEVKELFTDWEPVVKNSFSCCQSDEFMEKLRSLNRKQILLAGIEAHICVYQTACELAEQGYEVEVLCDASSSRTPENKAIGLEKMKAKGVGITSTEIALYELLKAAHGAEFKSILQLVK